MTIAWAIVASLLLFIGIVCRKRWSRLAGLGILAASVAKLLLADTSSLATPVRIGVFAAVGVMLIVGAFLYLKFNSRFEEMDQETSRPACRNQGDCSRIGILRHAGRHKRAAGGGVRCQVHKGNG